MDAITKQLVGYTQSFNDEDLTEPVLDAAIRHLVDSVACAIAGYDCEPAQVAIRVAKTVSSNKPATVFGEGFSTTPEMAAFANTIMVRGHDWNDGMLAKGGGHPSDQICAILAVGESIGASGREVLRSITLSYELLGALGNTVPGRDMGWDQGLFMGVSTTLGVGKLLGLNDEQLGNAVALALVPNIPMNITRVGALSMWKGCATAAAVRNAVFAAMMANEGMTGPSEPFQGKTALWDQVTGPFEVSLPAHPDGKRVVQISHMKQFPAESHSQSLLGLVPRIREWTSVEDIESIEIETYWIAFDEIGSHPAKWDPDTKETADHSLPYLLSRALVDGEINLSSFTPEKITDPSLRPLMNKIKIHENAEYTANYRPPGMEIAGSPKTHITIVKKGGDVFDEVVTFPKGHSLNPMTPEDINAKLDSICAGVVKDDQRDVIKKTWWGVDALPNISEAIDTIARFGRS